MLRRRTDRLEKIAAFCALGVAAVLALAGTVQDRFAGVATNEMWQASEDGGASMRQFNGKLLFSAAPGSDQPGFAGLICTRYALDCTKPWSLSFDYALKQARPTGGATTGPIFLLGFSTDDEGSPFEHVLAIQAYRSSRGAFVGRIDSVEGGDIVGPQTLASIPAVGTMVIAYTPSRDRLQIVVNGRNVATLNAFRAGDSLGTTALFGLGCLTQRGTGRCAYTDGVQLDNFQATGPGVIDAPWH
ncbi:MAG: hypothetical protein U0625_09355 [Phycisphaerales bacterium]